MVDLTEITNLRLDPINVPPYSARGITEELRLISDASQNLRTINWTLKNLSRSDFRKYAVTIQCTDIDQPALDGVWPGDTLTVDCVTELVREDTTTDAAARTAVAGTERTENGFVYYRPQLTMMVMDYRMETDEYGKAAGWVLELEEI